MKEHMLSVESPKPSILDRVKRGFKVIGTSLREKEYEDVQAEIVNEANARKDPSDLMDYAREMIRLHGGNASPAVNEVMKKAFDAAKQNPLVQAQIAREMMAHGKHTLARSAYEELMRRDKTNLEAKRGYADALVLSTADLSFEGRGDVLAPMFLEDLEKANKIYDELLASPAEEKSRVPLAHMKQEGASLRTRITSRQSEK